MQSPFSEIISQQQAKNGIIILPITLPLIAGTGVTVRRIAIWHRQQLSPAEIAGRIAHLSLAQVYAALTYYYANQEAIDTDIAAEEAEYDRLATLHKTSRST